MSAVTTEPRVAPTADGPRHPIDGVHYRNPATVQRFFDSGAWSPSTVGAALRQAALEAGDRVALVAGDERLTWADLDRRSDHVALGLLGTGLVPGDRVLVQMGTGSAIVLAFYGCWKAGIVPVCAVPAYRAYEIGALVERSGAVAHLVEAGAAGAFDLVAFAGEQRTAHPGLRHLIVAGPGAPAGGVTFAAVEAAGSAAGPRDGQSRLEAASPGPEDVLAFQLSGGSTGVPKVIPRFHGEYLSSAAAWADRLGYSGDDVLLWPLSLAHNAGMILMLIPALVRRARLVLLSRFEPSSFLDAVESERVTVAGSVGPIGPRLLKADLRGRDLSSLRHFFTLNGAADLERHLGVPCANMFGITEGLLLGSSPGDPAAARHGGVGRPASPFDEVKLVTLGGDGPVEDGVVGEFCFRGPSTLVAYYGDEEATAPAFTADGFFRSGDLMRMTGWGYAFEGRAKDNIDRGGEKFGVAAIEELLAAHPAITEAKVVGMPDPELGERVCAFVVLAAGHEAPTIGELSSFLLGFGLAKFKLPEHISALPELPTTAVGKLDRMALRRLAAAAAEQDG